MGRSPTSSAAQATALHGLIRWVESSAVALSALLVVISGALLYGVIAAFHALFPAGGGEGETLGSGGIIHSRETVALFAACGVTVALQHLVGKAGASGKWKSLPRRLQHSSTGLVIAALYSLLPFQVSVGAGGTGFVGLAIIQVLRGRSKVVEALFLEAFGPLLKEEERQGAPPAALSFLGGAVLSALVFPHRVCQVTILGAALADPAAACAGELLGGPRLLGKKTLIGTTVCALVGGACGACIAASAEEATEALLALVFVCTGLTTAVMELIGDLGPVGDDNFAVIFGSGAVLAALRAFLAPLAQGQGGHSQLLPALNLLFEVADGTE